MFIGFYNKSLILTYLGAALAVVGMYLALTENVKYAVLCLAVCGICDLFDGKVARMCKRTEDEKLFGVEVDSLADMVNFIVFPITIFIGLGLNQWYNVVIFVLYTLAAIERLGYFNVEALKKHTEVPVSYYRGLPVTYAALIIPVCWFIRYFVSEAVFGMIYTALMFIIALLFVSDIKIAKPKGMAYVLFGLLAIGVCLAIILV